MDVRSSPDMATILCLSVVLGPYSLVAVAVQTRENHSSSRRCRTNLRIFSVHSYRVNNLKTSQLAATTKPFSSGRKCSLALLASYVNRMADAKLRIALSSRLSEPI